MNIICERENCKHRIINNSLQNLNICGNQTIRISTTGRCKNFEKKYENFQAICSHPVFERRFKGCKYIKICTKCRKVIEEQQ